MDKNTKQVSGPVNVARLEGKINNITKVIYLFMDYHAPACSQTECENLFAKDIQLYLAENFDKLNKSDKIYDFFFEIYPTELQNVQKGYHHPMDVNYKEGYIWEIMKFFRKIFKYQPNENIVSLSDYFKNVRLHYIDVRFYFKKNYFQKINHAFELIHQMWSYVFINLHNLSQIIGIVEEIGKDCQNIINVLESSVNSYKKTGKISVIKFKDFSSESPPQPQEDQDKINEEHMRYLVYKLFTKYNITSVKNKMLEQINIIINNLKEIVSECQKIKDDFIKIGDKIYASPHYLLIPNELRKGNFNYGMNPVVTREMITYIFSSIFLLDDMYIRFFSRFMDVYFLRRFLDKNYITNAIVYTGAAHSNNYIEILLKEFGFHITHFSYAKITDLEKLEQEVFERNYDELFELFSPPIFNQCSDMSHFPENFL